jgi:hypothetical protein
MAATTGGRRATRPHLTGRDGDVLRWVGEQFCVRADVLAVLLAQRSPMAVSSGQVSERAVYRWLRRLEVAGLARQRSMLGRRWCVPTTAGMRFAGLADPEGKAWEAAEPSRHRLAHHHAAAVVRLWAEANGAAWESERWLRRRLEVARVHPPDGVVVAEDGRRWAVEVELTQKSDANLAGVLRSMPEDLAAVVYFTPAPMVERIRAQLARVAAAVITSDPTLPPSLRRSVTVPALRVEPLPEVPGVTYEGRW